MLIRLSLSLVCITSSALAKFPDSFTEPLEVIAFGSCNRDELPQPAWPTVTANKPDLWIWGGDNIYADWYQPGGKHTRIILIDNRYFAASPKEENTTLIGETQKAWLKEQLSESDADLHIIVTGGQFLSNKHRYEGWGQYPKVGLELRDTEDIVLNNYSINFESVR